MFILYCNSFIYNKLSQKASFFGKKRRYERRNGIVIVF